MARQVPPDHLDRHIWKRWQQLLPHKQGLGVLRPTKPLNSNLERLFQPAAKTLRDKSNVMGWEELRLRVGMSGAEHTKWSYLPVHFVGGAMPTESICSCRFCRRRCALRCQVTLCDARGAGSRRTILRQPPRQQRGRQRRQAVAGASSSNLGNHNHAHQPGEFWIVWSQELQNSLGLGTIQPTQLLHRLQKHRLRPAYA